MQEVKKAGTLQFICVLLWAALFGLVGAYVRFILPSYKIIGDFLTILLFCVLAYFVLVRYAAVYTYTFTPDCHLRLNRQIGKRNKEVEVALGDMKALLRKKPENFRGTVANMGTSVLSRKHTYYLIYNHNRVERAVLFEPGRELVKELTRRMEGKND
jgi:hypothetical protein